MPFQLTDHREKEVGPVRRLLSANATGVFWDVDCGLPDGFNAGQALEKIRRNLTVGAHRGPVTNRVYGDLTGLDFQSSDIKLNHFHVGEKREKMTKILEDINVEWSGENPEPSTGLLIMGDRGDAEDDISEVINLLRSRKNYKFLAVTPPPPPPPMVVTLLAALPRGGLL